MAAKKPARSTSENADNAQIRADDMVDAVHALTLRVAALENALNPLVGRGFSWCTWLASCDQMAHMPNDNNTGSSWATGERDFYNNFKAEAVAKNFMA